MPELPQPREKHRAAIALGSNLSSSFGQPRDNILAAVDRIRSLGRVAAVSSLIVTDPEIYTDQPQFVNAALVLETELSPIELLHALLEIERQLGRIRTGVPPKGPRVIDLDLIFYDDIVMETDELTLPHPGAATRSFVLKPLAEIAGDWVHPVTGVLVGVMVNAPEDRPLQG